MGFFVETTRSRTRVRRCWRPFLCKHGGVPVGTGGRALSVATTAGDGGARSPREGAFDVQQHGERDDSLRGSHRPGLATGRIHDDGFNETKAFTRTPCSQQS